MAVKVVDVELSEPLPDLQSLDMDRYTHVQLLVRQRSRPVGYAWVKTNSPRFLQPDYLRYAIEFQLRNQLRHLALDQALDSQPDLRTVDARGSDWPVVTVAVCTRGRPSSLERTLTSLVQLSYPPEKLDLLVVNNAPKDDATVNLVSRFPRLRLVAEPRPGLDWARNRAIAEARGEVIAFTDDDVCVDPLWVKALARHFANSSVMCVTGLVAPAERETKAQNLFEEYGGFGRGFAPRYYTMGVRKVWRFWPLGAGVFGTGCNMAYRRDLFAAIGTFDVALDVGTPANGGGDHDMFYRTLRAGYILVYEPAALVWHFHRQRLPQLRSQLYDFGRGVYAFWTKTFLADGPMRWHTLAFAILWYLRWFPGRMVRIGNFRRKLVLAEAWGALHGPIAYLLARRKARETARAFEAVDSLPTLPAGPEARHVKQWTSGSMREGV